jgi:tetratricopeptide (TPR) repeat protein
LDRAIELTKNKEDIEECAELYENRASILRTIGQLKESVEFHRLALDIATKKKRDRLRANILANMGTVFREMGQLNDSEFAYRQALELARALNAFGLQAQILAKSTSVLFHLGKHKEAENMARESIAICRHIGDHETEAKAHITLALLHYIDNSIDFEKEIQAVLQDDSISRENRAEALGLLALELRDQHRYDEAIEKIEDAITIGRINVIEQAASHFYAGMIYKEASLLNKALDHCENALKLAGSDAASHLTANVNQLQGDIYRENGDLNSAYRKYRAGMDKLELLRRNVAGEQNQSRSLGDLANIPEKLVNVLIEMDRTTEAFSALEAAKSRSLLERLSLIEIQAPQNVSSENRNKETHLIEQIRSLENRINNTVSLVQKERLISEFKKTVSDYNRLLDEISKVAPDFVELRRGKILAFEEVRELL